MSKAAELAALIGSQTALSNRNLIINGAMQVWQRSTDDTESGTGWGYRHADRYYTNKGRYRKETATIGGRQWDIMHIDDNSVGYNGGRGMIYKHEEYIDYSETLTLSFYAKASASSTVNVGASNFGGSQLISGQNITLTTSWERYDFQLTASSAPTQTGETYIINALDDGVDYYITGIQLEKGEQATPFEHRSFGDELARCQRYYQKSYAYGDTGGTVTNNGALWTNIIRNLSNQNYWDVRCYQVMRSSPTVLTYSTTSGVSGNYRNVTDSTTNASAVSNTSSSGFSIRPNSGTNQNIGDVIAVHWVADAEL